MPAKKLIEVALPLDAINKASAREKSIRHGHPSTLHLWWARRPLAAARAVIFASLVDDPDHPQAHPDFVKRCRQLPGDGPNVAHAGDTPRMRLFDFIERLVTWENTTDENIMSTARALVRIACHGEPPALLDPFAGGGSIPLEAQRLGLEAHASDLNPVAVMINKAMIEIPPRFANMPPVNPHDRKSVFDSLPHPKPLPHKEGGASTTHQHAIDSPSHEEAETSIDSPSLRSGGRGRGMGGDERWKITPQLERRMQAVARELRQNPTAAENTLWQAIRKRQLDGRKFRRQVAIGAFVVDFYCSSERLAIEVDGPIHHTQQEADQIRQELIESLGIRFVRLTNAEVEHHLPNALNKIRRAFDSLPHDPHPKPLPHKEGGASTTPQHAIHSPSHKEAGTSIDSPSLRSGGRGRGMGGDERRKISPSHKEGGASTTHPHPKPLPHKEGGASTTRQHAIDSPSHEEGGASTTHQIDSPSLRSGGRGRGMGGDDATWKGAAGLAADIRYYGGWMRDQAYEKIGHLYPKHKGETVIAWLWARTVISPNPAVNAPVPLVSSFALSKKKGRERWAKPIIEGDSVRFEVTQGKPPQDQQGTMIRRQGARCILSGEPITFDYIRAEGKAGRMGAQLMAIVTQGKHGRNYHDPTDEAEELAKSAQPEWKPMGDLPEQALGFQVQLYGMDEYHKLFTPRQLTALTTFSDLVAKAREQAYQDALSAGLPDDEKPLRDGGRGARAYSEAVGVYLAFVVDKGTDYWSNLCSWHKPGEKISHLFARQAIPMVWDYAEGNPFSDSTGNWTTHLNWVGKVIARLPAQAGRSGFANQQDAAQLDGNAITLSTDPPYYDNIGYADLSDFFYVWLRKNLRGIYPDIFGTMQVPKAQELVAEAARYGGKAGAKQHFESGMLKTFANIRKFVSHDYPLTVYYAFKQQDAGLIRQDKSPPKMRGKPKRGTSSSGWETMLTSLIQAGFSIVGTWPMRTEASNRMRARNSNVLASSIILVCRPRPDDAPLGSRRDFLQALRHELPAALSAMQSGHVAPVDMAQASIGPGMAIYSRYRRVLEADGTPIDVRAALRMINGALHEYLEELDGELDAESRFAIDWFSQFAFDEGDFGDADVLARAKNTSVESVVLAGLVDSSGGRVKLKHWSDVDPSQAPWDPNTDKRPTVWEAAHHLIEQVTHHGEPAAGALLAKMPDAMAGEARQLAYRLYDICESKGWAKYAVDYNDLVLRWTEISSYAARPGQANLGI